MLSLNIFRDRLGRKRDEFGDWIMADLPRTKAFKRDGCKPVAIFASLSDSV